MYFSLDLDGWLKKIVTKVGDDDHIFVKKIFNFKSATSVLASANSVTFKHYIKTCLSSMNDPQFLCKQNPYGMKDKSKVRDNFNSKSLLNNVFFFKHDLLVFQLFQNCTF